MGKLGVKLAVKIEALRKNWYTMKTRICS